MKFHSIPRFFGFMAALFFAGNAMAQETDFKDLPPVVVSEENIRVSEKVWDQFEKSFKGAENAKWYLIDKNYLVKFFKDEQENSVLFTKHGNLIYHISYGSEKNLPQDVRKMVRYSYLDHKITRAIKVNQANRSIWIVNLENDDNLVLARVEDGELEEVGNYQKSNVNAGVSSRNP